MIQNDLFNKTFSRAVVIILCLFSSILTLTPTALAEQTTIQEIQELLPDSISIEHKVVYVDFWASWCIHCRKSFPWMDEMLTKYSDSGLVVVTISVDKEHDDALGFLKGQNLNSINIFDPNGKRAEAFGLKVMPTSFVYDRSGALVLKHEGFRNKDREELETKLRALLHGETLDHE